MVVGDPGIWADRLKSIDTRFLECVVALWPRCLELLPSQPLEDLITMNLVDLLMKDPNVRRFCHYIEYHYEPFGYTAEGTAYSKGQVDVAVLLDQDRERYLAYECKRLNVVQGGKKYSLATEYVTEGVARFVNEKYAENLPIGCMLGYVLNGNVYDARLRIHRAITLYKGAVALTAGPEHQQSMGPAGRFCSRHSRIKGGREIEIRHALLPFSAET